MAFPSKDETDNHYGLLTVIGRAKDNSKDGLARWDCRCRCGRLFTTTGTMLRKGEAISCGCQKGTNKPSKYRNNRDHRVPVGRL
jgi:hypothetical protein